MALIEKHYAISLLALVFLLFASCKDEAATTRRAKPKAVSPTEAPSIRVHAEESDLVYRYFPTGERTPKTSMTLTGVPEAVRDLVIVIPPSGAPAGLAYVADLRASADDGTYAYRVVPTSELDQALDESRGPVDSTDKSEQPEQKVAANEVVMFSASWCGVCTQARRWFRNKGIEVIERDIEKDKTARQDMLKFAKQAGADGSKLNGVPVIFVNGLMFPGFDPYKIEAALKSGAAG